MPGEQRAHENLSEILDKAIAQLGTGESIEACLETYPQHAHALDPLLHAAAALQAEAATPLHPDMEAWLATGARDFAAIAQQLLPQPGAARPARAPRRARVHHSAHHTTSDLSTILDTALDRVAAGEGRESAQLGSRERKRQVSKRHGLA